MKEGERVEDFLPAHCRRSSDKWTWLVLRIFLCIIKNIPVPGQKRQRENQKVKC